MTHGFFRMLMLVGAALLSLTPMAGAQTTIAMKPAASADLAAPVTLAQIATLTGPDAERLSSVVVIAPPKAGATGLKNVSVDPGTVRRALESGGVNWAKVSLSGMVCTVKHVQPEPEPVAPAAPKREARPQPESIDAGGPATVRALLAQRLATLYGVSLDDLRLRFVSSAPEDVSLLDTMIDSSRRVEANPSVSSSSGRVTVRVDVYKGDRIMQSRSISIEALVRRSSCVAITTIDRDRVIGAADLTPDERWVAPSVETPVPLEKVVGQAAKRRIDPGRVVVGSDIRTPLSIKRGDEIVVRTLSGGMVLQSHARAMSSAREGEMVELRRDASKKSFYARAASKGIAVVNLESPAPDAAEPEEAPATGAEDNAP